MAFYEPSDPEEIQRRAMPNPNTMDECRNREIRHCDSATCPLRFHCEMHVITERANRRHGNISLWQVPSRNGEAVHGLYDNTEPYITQEQPPKKKK